MSELTKLITEAEDYVASVRRDISAGRRAAVTTSLQTRLQQIQVVCEKYEGKTRAIDPITGAPMYGAKMKEKTRHLSSLVRTLIDLITESCSMSVETNGIIEEATSSNTISSPSLPRTSVSGALDDVIVAQNGEREEQQLKEYALAAHSLDSTLRGKFAVVNRFRAALQTKLSMINRQYSPSALKKAGMVRATAVLDAVQRLIDCDCKPSGATTSGVVLRFLVSLLDSIILSPDDERMRTLRWRNAMLRERLPACGQPLLIILAATGFEISFDRLSTEIINLLEACVSAEANFACAGANTSASTAEEAKYKENLLFFIRTDEHDEAQQVSSFDALFASIVGSDKGCGHQDFLLLMHEPNLEVDMDRWVDWYDELKAVRDALGCMEVKENTGRKF